MGITGCEKIHIIYRIEPITPEEVLAASVPTSRLPGKCRAGATDAMVHPDACFHMDCHGVGIGFVRGATAGYSQKLT